MGSRTFFSEIRRGEKSRHWVALRHLLQNLDEKPDLHLRGLLQQSIESGRTLRLAQDAEPLLDSAELILEILIKCSGCHLLQGCLILINICQPLLSGPVQRILRRILTLRLLVEENLRGRTHAAGRQRRGETRHVCRSSQLVRSKISSGRRRTQRGIRGGLRSTVAVANDVASHGEQLWGLVAWKGVNSKYSGMEKITAKHLQHLLSLRKKEPEIPDRRTQAGRLEV